MNKLVKVTQVNGVHSPLGSSNSQETNMRTVLLTRQLTTMKKRSLKVKGPV